MNIISKLLALYRREPAATQAAVAIIWGGWIAIDRGIIHHTATLNWQVALAAAIALYGLLIRSQVIPVAKLQSALKGPPIVLPPSSTSTGGDGGGGGTGTCAPGPAKGTP